MSWTQPREGRRRLHVRTERSARACGAIARLAWAGRYAAGVYLYVLHSQRWERGTSAASTWFTPGGTCLADVRRERNPSSTPRAHVSARDPASYNQCRHQQILHDHVRPHDAQLHRSARHQSFAPVLP